MSTDVKRKGKARKAPPHLTPQFQRRARSHVSSESCRINGAKGFKATLQKHGPDVVFNGARQWQLNHPSSNELRMIGILSRLGIRYEREYRLGSTHYTVDFYLPGTDQAIEVNSRIHEQFDIEKRQWRATRKRKLRAERGIKRLTIRDKELAEDAGALIRTIQRFVNRKEN